jgi:hypothetical protein
MSNIAIVMNIELTDPQALALAQFVKRVGWTEIRANAANADEAYLIRDAVDVLRRELAAHGYAPR